MSHAVPESFILDVNSRTNNSFCKIFLLYHKPLIRFSNRYLNCLADAEDTVNEVLLQFWESNYVFPDTKSAKAFLYTATRNKSINFLKRKKKLIHNISFLENESTVDDYNNNFFEFELNFDYKIKSLLEAALGDLPHECERIMRYFKKGLNSSEIADILKIAPSTVRSQKKRGISIIKDAYNWSELY